MGRILAHFAIGLVTLMVTPLGLAQSASEDGRWAEPFDLPLISIHAAALPTGKVLLFGSGHGVPGIHGWVLDPRSLELTEVPPGWDLNCSGHNFLSDGRLLVGGGTLLVLALGCVAAIAAITRVPAEIFSVTDAGVLRPGTLANVVVWNGDPLDTASWLIHLFIRGKSLDLATRQDLLTRRYRSLGGSP